MGLKSAATLFFLSFSMLALASCGSSTSTVHGPLTKAEAIQQGDAICKRDRRRRNRLKVPNVNPASPSASQLKAQGASLNSRAKIIRSQVAKLKALGPPTTDAAGFAKAVGGGKTVAAAQAAAGQAALSGDIKAYKAAYAKLTKEGRAASTALKQYGFKVCGQGG